MSTTRIGIDLGTAYSSVSYLDDHDKPQPIPGLDGEWSTPSVVFVPESGEPPIVGQQAMSLGLDQPWRLIRNAKRCLGRPGANWTIGKVIYTPVDVSAIILRKLLEMAALTVGPIDTAVVTVPAHFTGYQRKLTIDAARLAGLAHVGTVNEPVAAALSFVLAGHALGEDATILFEYMDEASTILVYDLGGGTFDLSIVRCAKNQLRVVATSGEQNLGGIDWDQQLVDIVATPLAKIHADVRCDQRALTRLAQQVEIAKRNLSDAPSTVLTVSNDGWSEEFQLERTEFEARTRHLAEQTRMRTERLLETCNLSWDDLDAFVPVGGSTRMPMVRRVIQEMAAKRSRRPDNFQENFVRDVSPELSVAQGAALFAGIIGDKGSGALARSTGSLSKLEVRNVITNSLGIMVRDTQSRRINHPLIARNERLPASAHVSVSTTRPDQRRATITIIEGEPGGTGAAQVVCKCVIEDLPPGLPKDSIFDVELMFDVDGLLHVIAKHRQTERIATVSVLHT